MVSGLVDFCPLCGQRPSIYFPFPKGDEPLAFCGPVFADDVRPRPDRRRLAPPEPLFQPRRLGFV